MTTLPADRTAQEWVDFYLQIENDIASGKSVSLNGRRVEFEDLAEIRKARADWERRGLMTNTTVTKTIGGVRYKTAALN